MSRAKILSDRQIQVVLKHARPMMAVAVLASFRCGLRARELVALDWSMILDAEGQIGEYIDLPAISSKGRRGAGRLPITADLRIRLVTLWWKERTPTSGRILHDAQYKPLSADAIRFRLNSLFKKAGLQGVSSHSGRRTFGTNLARHVNLSSVQKALRHARPATTLLYIDAVSDPELVAAINLISAT